MAILSYELTGLFYAKLPEIVPSHGFVTILHLFCPAFVNKVRHGSLYGW